MAPPHPFTMSVFLAHIFNSTNKEGGLNWSGALCVEVHIKACVQERAALLHNLWLSGHAFPEI